MYCTGTGNFWEILIKAWIISYCSGCDASSLNQICDLMHSFCVSSTLILPGYSYLTILRNVNFPYLSTKAELTQEPLFLYKHSSLTQL